MPVFKNPQISKIKNYSNAKIVIQNDPSKPEAISYEEKGNREYQVFFLNNELIIENKLITDKKITVYINQSHIDFIDCKRKSFLEIDSNVSIHDLKLSEKAFAKINNVSIDNISLHGDSHFESNKINSLKQIDSYDNSFVYIKNLQTDNLILNHHSDSSFEISSGYIQSLIAENKSQAAHLKVDATVANADFLNCHKGLITAKNISQSLTAILQSYGGIEIKGSCSDFVHIQNQGNNYSSLEGLNSQRVHFINNADSHISLSGKAEKLFFASHHCSIGSFNKLICQVADISLEHGSKVELHVTDAIEAKLSNNSFLNLTSTTPLKSSHIDADISSQFLVGQELNLPKYQTHFLPNKKTIAESILAMRENLNIKEKAFSFFKK